MESSYIDRYNQWMKTIEEKTCNQHYNKFGRKKHAKTKNKWRNFNSIENWEQRLGTPL
jgi:hypothetical protein